MAKDLRRILEQLASNVETLFEATVGKGNAVTLERTVLTHGEEFGPAMALALVGLKLGKPKMCFMNATHAALFHGASYDYVEGYAMSSTISFPFHHAWVAAKGSNTPIDVTIADPKGYQYIGVRFTEQELAEEVARLKVYGLLDTGTGLNRDLITRISKRNMTNG